MDFDLALLPDYAPGMELTLLVDKANEPFPEKLHVTIVREITTTMSPVLEVTYTDDSGTATKRAVLKLYDRRLGSSLRVAYEDRTDGKRPELEFAPATTETEISYRNYVRIGKASQLWNEIDANEDYLGWAWEYHEHTEEGLMRFEGALQHTCLYYFQNEIAVYERLAHMQGDCIPRMLAHVHLPSTTSSEMDYNVEDKVEDKVNDQIEDNTGEKMKELVEHNINDEFDDPNSSTLLETTCISPLSSSPSSSIASKNSSRNPSPASSRTTSSSFSVDDIDSKTENKANGIIENDIMGDQVNDEVGDNVEDKINDTRDDRDEDSPFLRVNGVLLEYVSGTPLSDFVKRRPPLHKTKWISVLQDAVNTADKINRAGVLMEDCRAANVLLRPGTWQPVFLDFAQARVGNLDENTGFRDSVRSEGNPRGLVWPLVSLGDWKGGVRFKLAYPDYNYLSRQDDSDSEDSEEPTPPPSDSGT